MNTHGGQTLRCSQGGWQLGASGTAAPRQAATPTGGSPEPNYGFYPVQANVSIYHKPASRKPPGRIFSV